MIYGVYAVKDILIGFNAPFIMGNDEVAKRTFKQTVGNKPERNDLQLWKLGNWNDETGTFTNNSPLMLAFGKEDNNGI